MSVCTRQSEYTAVSVHHTPSHAQSSMSHTPVPLPTGPSWKVPFSGNDILSLSPSSPSLPLSSLMPVFQPRAHHSLPFLVTLHLSLPPHLILNPLLVCLAVPAGPVIMHTGHHWAARQFLDFHIPDGVSSQSSQLGLGRTEPS